MGRREACLLVGVGGGAGEALDGDGVDGDNQVVVGVVVAAGAEAGVEPGTCSQKVELLEGEAGEEERERDTYHRHPFWTGRSRRWRRRGR